MANHHRPELHITVDEGLLFAPAGALLNGEIWHFFHQYRPSVEAGPRWAHQYAEHSPFNWEVCDDVLAPIGGETQVRAGSVVPHEGGVDLYFTSVTATGSAIHLAHISNLCATTQELSEDPLALDPHTIRIGKIVGDTEKYTNFRSPCVVANDDSWLMLAVTGSGSAPVLVILTSTDARDWQLVGELNFNGYSGLSGSEVLVSPRLIRLRDEVDDEIYDIVIVTVEKDGVDISGYVVGKLDGAEFTVSTPFTRVDHGHDFSRPRNTNYTESNRFDQAHIFGLMNGIGRLDDPTKHKSWLEEGWANAISVPRVVTLQGGTLFQTPPTGLLDAIYHSDQAAGWTALCEIPAGSSVSVSLEDQHGNIAAVVTHRHNELIIDRSMNPYYPDDQPAIAPLTDDDTDSLFILVDGSTLEVFADGGYVSMASRVYFTNGPISNFTISTTGEAAIVREEHHFPDFDEPFEGLVR